MIRNQIGGIKRIATVGLLSLLMVVVGEAQAATPGKKPDTPAHKLNVAQQQTMLGERLSRTWAMKAQDNLRGRATIQFDEDSRRYARQLKYLQAEADTPELKDNYAQLEQRWTKFLEVAETGAGQTSLPPLVEQSNELAAVAEKSVGIMRQRMGAEASEGVFLAGQARTLSQRMAKLHFFRSLGSTAPFIANDLKKSETDYLTSIKRLRDLSEDRPKSAAIIALVDQQWVFFAEIIRRPASREDRDQVNQVLAKSSDGLLSALEDLSQSFEQ